MSQLFPSPYDFLRGHVPRLVSFSPALRNAYLLASCWVFYKWLVGDFSAKGLLVVGIFSLALLLLTGIAKRFPLIGKAIGVLFIFAPVLAWLKGAYDSTHFHSDGSPAGLIILFFVVLLSLASVWLGIILIQVANDTTEYSDADKAELITKVVRRSVDDD